ncbi:hypothetical protein Rsub_10633 [Raphidocelis subcapitata]|uniref:Uncharacterized protein n=1 Tax=Raphidocelis subcapitata TaxID=307507 RepID=A0A2V0PJ79_9CHLO|nr:hypothetical protein Rsub_10633 [Raphidocelis subcapitata]|eukprot:GBF97960.1 hypothetical protein Rsub_10633 [Raphidocelis subcapitata]
MVASAVLRLELPELEALEARLGREGAEEAAGSPAHQAPPRVRSKTFAPPRVRAHCSSWKCVNTASVYDTPPPPNQVAASRWYGELRAAAERRSAASRCPAPAPAPPLPRRLPAAYRRLAPPPPTGGTLLQCARAAHPTRGRSPPRGDGRLSKPQRAAGGGGSGGAVAVESAAAASGRVPAAPRLPSVQAKPGRQLATQPPLQAPCAAAVDPEAFVWRAQLGGFVNDDDDEGGAAAGGPPLCAAADGLTTDGGAPAPQRLIAADGAGIARRVRAGLSDLRAALAQVTPTAGALVAARADTVAPLPRVAAARLAGPRLFGAAALEAQPPARRLCEAALADEHGGSVPLGTVPKAAVRKGPEGGKGSGCPAADADRAAWLRSACFDPLGLLQQPVGGGDGSKGSGQQRRAAAAMEQGDGGSTEGDEGEGRSCGAGPSCGEAEEEEATASSSVEGQQLLGELLGLSGGRSCSNGVALTEQRPLPPWARPLVPSPTQGRRPAAAAAAARAAGGDGRSFSGSGGTRTPAGDRSAAAPAAAQEPPAPPAGPAAAALERHLVRLHRRRCKGRRVRRMPPLPKLQPTRPPKRAGAAGARERAAGGAGFDVPAFDSRAGFVAGLLHEGVLHLA